MIKYFRMAHFYAKVLVIALIAALAAATFGNWLGGSMQVAKVLFIVSFAIVFDALAHRHRGAL